MSVETMGVGKCGFSRLLVKQMLVGLVMPVLLALPAIGVADVITFEQLVIDPLVDLPVAQTEGAFQYKATLGEGWAVQNTFGNPVSALVTRFTTVPDVLDVVEIKLTGGGLFRFVSVDFLTLTNDNNDSVSITGSLGGNPTGTLSLNTPTQTFQTFETAVSGFSSSIDLLTIQVTSVGASALILDNFTFAVPEPSTFALVLLGAFFGFLSFVRRRSNWR